MDRLRISLIFADGTKMLPNSFANRMTAPTLTDRVLGCIIGGAIGDCLGGPYEGQFGPLEFRVPEILAISDDTQLTLATCEAIAKDRRANPESIAARVVAWYRAGRVSGVGGSTLKALRDLDAGAHWALSGRKGEMGAGNGAAMRAAPLAFVLDPDVDTDRTTLRDICRITHHNDEAYIGALAIVRAIRLIAFGGHGLDASLPQTIAKTLPDSRVRDRLAEFSGAIKAKSLSACARQFGSSGYVVDSVPLSIVAAACCANGGIRTVFQAIIECGGDTDSNASMAGQIAGAAFGIAYIPTDLICRLADLPPIQEIAYSFAAVTGK